MFSTSSALVCLSVSMHDAQKLLDRFSQNSVERWHVDPGRNLYISVVVGITLR